MFDHQRPMNEILVDQRRECTLELAGMLKEKEKGSIKDLKRIIAKFALQESRTIRKSREYLNCLIEAGLVKISKGKKSWRYNPEEEWELFKVDI